MEKRKLAIVLILLVACALAVWLGPLFVPRYSSNPNIPAGLSYTSFNYTIPENYLINSVKFSELDFVYTENDEYYCKPIREKAAIVDYYSYSEPGLGGKSLKRYAVVCGDNYIIVDLEYCCRHDVYGPFQKT